MKGLIERLRKNHSVVEVTGLLMIVAAGAALLALVTYDAADPSWFNQPGRTPSGNLFGWGGATAAEILLQLFGTTAFLLPLATIPSAWRRMTRGSQPWAPGRTATRLLVLASLCCLLDLLFGKIAFGGEKLFPAGGVVGLHLANGLERLIARSGALVVSATTLLVVLVLTTRLSLVRTWELTAAMVVRGAARAREYGGELWQRLRGWLDERAAQRQAASGGLDLDAPAPEPPPLTTPRPSPPPAPAAASPGTIRLEPKVTGDAPTTAARRPEARRPRQRPLPLEGKPGEYRLPPTDLLNEPEPQAIESEQELRERARQITDKFREFNVNGSVVAIHPGPVVTTFEFKPEAGIKYSKITGMTDDLSLALKAESVRIDRMAGRSTVGIEVPNRRQETIYPRDLFDSSRFRDSRSRLTLAFGKDIGGHVFTAELERMPHLLIAGATGSGKSVGLNGMIASILFKASPEEVRLIMIDTKMIELGIYADIPHLLIPVVTEPKLASTALKWAVREMELRYRKLAAVGVRNLSQFNDLLTREPDRTWTDPREGDDTPLDKLPQIVIVIDELADLMMVSSSDVEESIMRLAQMARAVGIHLIIATQRPSVDVITGTIKANFPSRIAFRVSQRVDSRTIIDQQGAEHLLGRGDMLFLSSGSSRLKRLHGGFITETELNRLTDHIKRMADPVYDETILREGEEGGESIDGEERDEMYARAVRTVLTEGKCSITLIQRRLQLGYARAARIVDMMEREGVVSVGEGSKPREILVGPEFLETIESGQPPSIR